MLVAPASASTFQDNRPLVRFFQVREGLFGVTIEDDRSRRDSEDEILAVLAEAVLASAVAASWRFVVALIAKVEQRERFGSTTNTTFPPRPPSPPSGPPFGTYFSVRKVAAPFPPSPACASIST